ncbi:hypothetical protein [Mycolicibacterium houstonense]|uniref:hypothetical protein n=1 Tax=Mycolicibacterium houstonense TaxID=146021 RepID=UPI003F96A33C
MAAIALCNSALDRIDHLIGPEQGSVVLPGLAPPGTDYDPADSIFDLLSPTLLVEGTPASSYLIAVYSTNAEWTLVGLHHLTHSRRCADPACIQIRSNLEHQRKTLPAQDNLFTRTYAQPKVNWLPQEIPYLRHMSERHTFDGSLSAGIRVELF